MHFGRVTPILGGSGITEVRVSILLKSYKVWIAVLGSLSPWYQLLTRVPEAKGDETKLAVIDANKRQADIFLREEPDGFDKKHGEQFRIEHVLTYPSDSWDGRKGHVNAEVIKGIGFEPKEGILALLSGPPAMIQKAALPALRDWSYEQKTMGFDFSVWELESSKAFSQSLEKGTVIHLLRAALYRSYPHR